MKKSIFYLLMLLTTGIIITAGSEVILRLFMDEPPSIKPPTPRVIDPYKYNPYILYRRPYIIFHIPNSYYFQLRSNYKVEYKINSLGFRGPEVPKKDNTTFRLLFIGDSFVEGHGCNYADTFSFLLDQNLRESGWEIINVGVQGGSPITYASNINRYLSLEPDAVLIMIYENDIYEDRVRESDYFNLPFLNDEERLLFGRKKRKNVLYSSRIHCLLRGAWKKIHKSQLEKIIWNNKQNFSPDECQKALNSISPYLVAPSMFETEWHMSRRYLDYTVKAFQKRGTGVLIANLSKSLLIPGRHEAHKIHALTLDSKISAWARESELPFLNLALTAINCGTNNPYEIIIEDDGHLTKKGHQLIEQNLRPWLIRHLPKQKLLHEK